MKILTALRNDPRIYKFCHCVVILYSIACVGTIIYKQAFPASRALDTSAREFYNSYQKPPQRNTTYTPSLLSHHIIKMDAEDGIIGDATTSDALANVNHYLSAVARRCKYTGGEEAAKTFLICANGVLHENFYYHAADDAGRRYAEHSSDCDANVFLMMDAAKIAGLPTYLVYAPGHAFIAWKDKNNDFRYHETTGGNNKGRPFDFKNQLYKKAMSRIYYLPLAYDDPVISATYRSLTSSISGRGGELYALSERYPSNVMIVGALWHWKRLHGAILPKDVERIESTLKTEVTDSDLYLSLTDFYLRTGKTDQARENFDKIPARDCGDECYDLGIRFRITKFEMMYPIWKFYTAYMSELGVKANTWTFWGIWPKVILLLVVLSFITHWVLTSKQPDQTL